MPRKPTDGSFSGIYESDTRTCGTALGASLLSGQGQNRLWVVRGEGPDKERLEQGPIFFPGDIDEVLKFVQIPAVVELTSASPDPVTRSMVWSGE